MSTSSGNIMKRPLRTSRITTWLALAGSLVLAACGGGGAPTTANEANAPSTSSAATYTGPAPATGAAQALDVRDGHQGGGRPQLLARGPERLRADLDHLDHQLGQRHRVRLGDAGAIGGAAVRLGGTELELPSRLHGLRDHDLQQRHQQVLLWLPLAGSRHTAV